MARSKAKTFEVLTTVRTPYGPSGTVLSSGSVGSALTKYYLANGVFEKIEPPEPPETPESPEPPAEPPAEDG